MISDDAACPLTSITVSPLFPSPSSPPAPSSPQAWAAWRVDSCQGAICWIILHQHCTPRKFVAAAYTHTHTRTPDRPAILLTLMYMRHLWQPVSICNCMNKFNIAPVHLIQLNLTLYNSGSRFHSNLHSLRSRIGVQKLLKILKVLYCKIFA